MKGPLPSQSIFLRSNREARDRTKMSPQPISNAFGLSNDVWTAVSAIGTVLAAFATVWAVLVALWLARRDKAQNIVCHAYVTSKTFKQTKGTPFGSGIAASATFEVSVANAGYLPVTLTGLLWRIRTKSENLVVTQDAPMGDSMRFPLELGHAQASVARFIHSDVEKTFGTLMSMLRSEVILNQRIKGVDVGVETSLGQRFFAPVEPKFWYLLKGIARPSDPSSSPRISGAKAAEWSFTPRDYY